MREILGTAKNIRALLSGAKYGVDYYQREYKWQTKHVVELIDDLAEKFLGSYDGAHERSAVESYGHYFLGSIIISERDAKKIYHRRPAAAHDALFTADPRSPSAPLTPNRRGQLAELIFSQKFGKRSCATYYLGAKGTGVYEWTLTMLRLSLQSVSGTESTETAGE